MTEPQTCEACGQPMLIPLSMQRCDKCDKTIGETGGRYVQANGVCVPFCLDCAPSEARADGLEAKLI